MLIKEKIILILGNQKPAEGAGKPSQAIEVTDI
jgi:hypothetical protein